MDLLSATRPEVDTSNPLAVGTQLQEFVIERLIGVGGFGIVYQANDTLLHRTVAIKEYMPSAMALRSDGATISLRSESHVQDFDTGKDSFINEARMLARFKHPALIEVFRFWEQNRTAYMATPYYQGSTLKEHLRATPGVPSEAKLKQVLLPVLDALEHMHGEQVYHRDISPDNIMILDAGNPILLDLGAARRLRAETVHAVTVMVKPGYAPIEQYSSDAAVQQGPWTDIYGWGATAYFALTGKPPPPSASRIMNDAILRLVELKPEGYSLGFLSAIDAALAVRPDDRPQSIAALKGLLAMDIAAESIVDAQQVQAARLLPEPVYQPDTSNDQFSAPLGAAPAVVKKSTPPALIGGLLAIAMGVVAIFWFAATATDKAIIAVPKAPLVAPTPAAPAVPMPAPSAEVKTASVVAVAPVKAADEKPAIARFSVKPWGEVFVNGESRGVSPPVKSLNLPAGNYQIEIRNGDYPAYKASVTLKPGQVFKANHAFEETPIK
jgi:serine/threonine protein kinase